MRFLAGILTTVFAATAGASIVQLLVFLAIGVRLEVLDGFVGAFLLSVLFGIAIAAPTTLVILPVLSLAEEEGLLPAAGAIGGFVSVAVVVVVFVTGLSLPPILFLAAAGALGALVGWWAGHVYEAVLKRLRRDRPSP